MNVQTKNMKQPIRQNARNIHLLGGTLMGFMLAIAAPATYAGGTNANYAAVPPILSTGSTVPSVLVVLDNSNSMDEAPDGQAVGSDNPGSKSEIARGAVKNIITSFTGKMRMGLMAYQQNANSRWHIHNSQYYASYDPTTYDPTYVPTGAPITWTKNRYRIPNPDDPGNYIYYNRALPYYSSTNDGAAHCYSPAYSEAGGNNFYNCYDVKTGTSDSNTGYSTPIFNGSFSPTDSDLAQGFNFFGQRLAWTYVGRTWFNNSSPGYGFLHIPIADLDATQAAKLNLKLATSHPATDSNAPTDPTKPLQNAGLTPLEGTLDTALRYFDGTGIGATEKSSLVTSSTYVPTSGGCGEEKYVVLVTDGLPSTDTSGNKYATVNAGITAVAAKAAALNAAGVKVYVVGFALPITVNPTVLDTIASAGGTSTAYSATDATSLNATLNAIFQDIQGRTSSGSSAAVVSNSGQGTGAIYQALYNAKKTDAGNSVKWIGKVHALFIDDRGYFREDANSNGQLDSYTTDYVVSIYYDSVTNTTKYQRYTSADGGATLTASGSPIDFDNIVPIWDASNVMSTLDQTSIVTQRAYSTAVSNSAGGGRYIVTNINNTMLTFEWDSSGTDTTKISSLNYRYLGVSTTAEAANIVDFIRGKEGIAGYRSRTLNSTRYLLGDIIHSAPTVVGAPSAGYDTAFGDDSYSEFRQKYLNRRQVVYVGGNDGMVHAFNAGFWDQNNKAYRVNGGGTLTQHPLGAELWAFIPQNLLPHLQWLKNTNYSHVYYMDGSPTVFDANIFPNDATHPNGWGTVLVIGMRLGGGAMTVDTNGDGTEDWTTGSSYVVLDITDPEQPPSLIAELNPGSLGLTTSKPVVVKKRVADSSGNWKNFTGMTNNWYLAFGSGAGPNGTPAQAQTAITNVEGDTAGTEARVYLYNLGDPKKSIARGFVSGYATGKTTGLGYSFVGDPTVADWGNDYQDDAVYFGTIGKPGSATTEGSLYRLRLSDNTVQQLLNVNKPLVSSPLLSIDNNGDKWIHAGTGRLFAQADNSTNAQQLFVGVKEPLNSTGNLTYATVSLSSLQNVTGVQVFANNAVQDPNNVLIDAMSNPLPISTFKDLETYIQTSKAGWFMNFPTNGANPSSRSVTAATRVNRILLYTDYTPSNNVCSPEGSSSLYAVNLKTGTAEGFAPLGTDPLSVYNTFEEAYIKTSLGAGLATTPSVHTGANTQPSGGVKVITNTSTGAIQQKYVRLPPTTSGRQTWREIEDF